MTDSKDNHIRTDTHDSGVQMYGEQQIQQMITDEVRFEDKSINMKIFHIILLTTSIISPILLIGAFLYATFSAGNDIGCCSISESLANPDTHVTVIVCSIIAASFACFVSCCRQIQIRVKFIEYNQSKLWLRFNRASVICNILGYICIVLLCIFKTIKYPKLHLVFS
eukprot:164319_1